MNDNEKNLNTRARRMDFGAGRGQMSPEMRAAQEKLAKIQKQRAKQGSVPVRRATRPVAQGSASVSRVTRTATGRTASGATIRRTSTAVRYTATSGAPRRAASVTRPSASEVPTGLRQQNMAPATPVSRPRRPKITPQRPAAPQRPLSGSLPTEPRERAKSLETISFDALDALGTSDSAEALAQSFVEEPKPLSKVVRPDKHKRSEKASKSPQAGKSAGSQQPDTSLNNEKAVLGGKSPFINTLNIEKRPLSGHSVKKKTPAAKKPQPQPYLTPNDNVPTVVNTKRKNRKSNIALAIAIFLTVVLGAVVGTFVYLAFFQ